MSKMRISRLLTVCLLILILCFATSCDKQEPAAQEPQDAPGTVYVLNGFETTQEMFSIRPASSYMSASMEITDSQVMAGQGSMKYSFEQGNWPDMVLHIRESAYPELDIANLKKTNLAVYNDNDVAVNCVMTVAVGGNKTLLSKEFTLEPKQWNDLEFRLSALACKFNADQILGFRFRMEAPENSVFYFDQWTVTMGAENTDEDNTWEPKLMDIISRIDSLPGALSASDEQTLEALYMEYAQLPEVYRNIVPNYARLETALQDFVKVKYTAQEDTLERQYLAFDQFYGVGQLTSGNYSILYQTEVKYGDQKGSLKITFDGSTKESYFPYFSPLDPKRYDYIEISVYNDDDVRKVIYFNWKQRLVVEPHTWGTMKIVGEELMANGNLIVDSIDQLGTRIQSRGTIYLGAAIAYRRDLLAELKKLPDADEFQMDRDIKYLTLIENTLALYNKTPEAERAQLPAELVDNLLACSIKIAGYHTVFDATQEDIEFGTPDCAAVGGAVPATNEEYGPVWELTFTEKAPGAYAAGFRFVKDMSSNRNLFFYIYNPKSSTQMMELYADGSWNNLEMRELAPGWNCIDIPADVPTSNYIFGLFSKNANVIGTWKVSSLYEVSDDIVNCQEAAKVSALIAKLPAADTIQMPEGLKYVADIWEAKDAYDVLSSGGKALVSGTGKLNACLKAVDGYKAAMNSKTDIMTAGTPDCHFNGSVSLGRDDTYGPVWQLNVYKTGSGDYAAGWQVEKNISADKNLFFYIYNPKDTAQMIYLYANPSWTSLEGRMLNPGWNLVEVPKNIVIDRYLFGLFPKDADVSGQWLISSVFSKSQALVDQEEATAVAALIDSLPGGDTIQMPRDIKLLTEIDQAQKGYAALSSAARKYITQAQLDKLDACAAAAEGYLVVVNALSDDLILPPDSNGSAIIGKDTDSQYGPVFTMNITQAGTAPYTGGIQMNKDMTGFHHKFFYMYNPTDVAQPMWMYADNNWESYGLVTLQPGWNKVEPSDSITVDGYLFGLFPNANITGTWKVSSLYALSDGLVYADQIAEVEALIDSLKDADALTLADRIAVRDASAAFEALTESAQTYVKNAEKLEACVAKMAELTPSEGPAYVSMLVADLPEATALKVSHKDDVAEAKAAFETLTAQEQAEVVGTEKLRACIDKVAYWEEMDARIIADAAETDFSFDGQETLDVDNNTFGRVMTITGGTGIKLRKEWLKGDAVEIYIYNPTASDVKAYYTADWVYNVNVTLKANAWTRVLVQNTGAYGGQDFLTQDKDIYLYIAMGSNTWKFSSVYEAQPRNLEADASEVQAMIAALPEATAIGSSHKAAIADAKAAYDKLSATEQAKVTNAAKLTACLEKVAAWDAWDARTVISAATNMMNPYNVDDNTYGKVWTPQAGSTYQVIRSTGAAYAACQAIEFYIYNPTDVAVNGFMQNDADWSNVGNFTLAPKTWTKITVQQKTVAGKQLLSSNVTIYLYVNFAGEGWKVSGIFSAAAAPEATAADVETLIAALPEATAIGGSHKTAINAAKAAYDKLSATEQAKVSNAAKLTACLEKVSAWEALDERTVVSASTTMIAAHADDNTYGTVWTPKAGNTYEVIQSKAAAYSACQAIEFYIYNPTAAAVNGFIQDDVAWSNVASFTLAPKAWTKITVAQKTISGKQLLSANVKMYLYVNFAGEGWKMTGIFDAAAQSAVSAADVETQIAALPEATAIGGSHKTAINAAKAAYDKLSATEQAKVVNAAKLTACLEKVAAWETLDAKTAISASTTMIAAHADDNTYGTVWTPKAGNTYEVIQSKAAAYTGSKTVEFYIYNPTDTAVNGFMQDDASWSNVASFTLAPKAWTKITIQQKTLTGGKQLISSNVKLYLYVNFAGEGWKMSSIFTAA